MLFPVHSSTRGQEMAPLIVCSSWGLEQRAFNFFGCCLDTNEEEEWNSISPSLLEMDGVSDWHTSARRRVKIRRPMGSVPQGIKHRVLCMQKGILALEPMMEKRMLHDASSVSIRQVHIYNSAYKWRKIQKGRHKQSQNTKKEVLPLKQTHTNTICMNITIMISIRRQ